MTIEIPDYQSHTYVEYVSFAHTGRARNFGKVKRIVLESPNSPGWQDACAVAVDAMYERLGETEGDAFVDWNLGGIYAEDYQIIKTFLICPHQTQIEPGAHEFETNDQAMTAKNVAYCPKCACRWMVHNTILAPAEDQ